MTAIHRRQLRNLKSTIMNRATHLGLSIVASILLLTSCVSSKKFKAAQSALASAWNDSAILAGKVTDQEGAIEQLKQQVGDLNNKVKDLTNQTGRLSSDVANKNSQLGKSQQD